MSAIRCPHCDAVALMCAKQQQTPLSRKEWHRCTNLECGHTFVSFTEIQYTLAPAAHPRPGVSLPRSQHVDRPHRSQGPAGPALHPHAARKPARKAAQVFTPRAPAEPDAGTPGRLHMVHLVYRTGLQANEIRAAIKAGTFPGPVGMAAQSATWDETAVNAWINSRGTAA